MGAPFAFSVERTVMSKATLPLAPPPRRISNTSAAGAPATTTRPCCTYLSSHRIPPDPRLVSDTLLAHSNLPALQHTAQFISHCSSNRVVAHILRSPYSQRVVGPAPCLSAVGHAPLRAHGHVTTGERRPTAAAHRTDLLEASLRGVLVDLVEGSKWRSRHPRDDSRVSVPYAAGPTHFRRSTSCTCSSAVVCATKNSAEGRCQIGLGKENHPQALRRTPRP